jgi:hypothetical protein
MKSDAEEETVGKLGMRAQGLFFIHFVLKTRPLAKVERFPSLNRAVLSTLCTYGSLLHRQ